MRLIGTGIVNSSGSGSGSEGVSAANTEAVVDTIFFKLILELNVHAMDMIVSSTSSEKETTTSAVEKKVLKGFSVSQVVLSLERGTVCLLDDSRLKLYVFDYINSEEDVSDKS